MSVVYALLVSQVAIPILVNRIHTLTPPCDEKRVIKERLLLHSFICTELGLGFCSIASLNPSLSAGLALTFVPAVLVFLHKRSAALARAVQGLVVGVLMQPSMLLLGLVALLCVCGRPGWGDDAGILHMAGREINKVRFDYDMFGHWVWPLFIWVYAVVMGAQVLIGM